LLAYINLRTCPVLYPSEEQYYTSGSVFDLDPGNCFLGNLSNPVGDVMNINWISPEFLTRIDKKRAIFAAAVIAPASLRPSQAVKLITSTEWIFPHLSFAKHKEKPLPNGRGSIMATAFPL
jgi:hypothetical protein